MIENNSIDFGVPGGLQAVQDRMAELGKPLSRHSLLLFVDGGEIPQPSDLVVIFTENHQTGECRALAVVGSEFLLHISEVLSSKTEPVIYGIPSDAVESVVKLLADNWLENQ